MAKNTWAKTSYHASVSSFLDKLGALGITPKAISFQTIQFVLMIAHMEPFRDRHKGATPGSA